MNILSRYIIKQFLINFVILLTVVMLLFVMVDLILDADEFIEAGKRWSRHAAVLAQVGQGGASYDALDQLAQNHASADAIMAQLPLNHDQAARLAQALKPSGWAVAGETLYRIADYYGPMILMIYVFFSGLIVVAAMGFTYAALSRTRELTAMVSSGISLYRVATPVLVVGAGLNAVTLPMQEFVIPRMADQLSRGKSDIKNVQSRSVALQLVSDGHDDLLSAARFSFDKQQLEGVVIQRRNDQRITVERITAVQAQWDSQRHGWALIQGYAVQPSVDEPGGGRLTLNEAIPCDFFETPMTPAVLQARRATSYPYLLPMSQLRPMQGNVAVGAKNQARITKIIWGRFSLLVLNVLVLVMGLAFFLSRSPMNMLVQAVKCAGVCIGAWAGGIVMLQGGEGWLPPIAAAWLPVVIYLPVSAWLLQTIKT